MKDWREGLIEAFPVPEDRRPGYKRRAKKAAEEAARLDAEAIIESLTRLDLSRVPSTPFPFFSLPSEIRNTIYGLVLFSKPAYRAADGRRHSSRIASLLVSKKMHTEASYVLYSVTRFHLFHVQLFETAPTVVEVPRRYRDAVKNVKMTLGPSWTKPPASWAVDAGLARYLKRLKGLRTLRVMVEFDPSHPTFARYRRSETFYTDFCGELLRDVLQAMPQVESIELDGNPGVDVSGPLVTRLRLEAHKEDTEVRWGREANWAQKALPLSL